MNKITGYLKTTAERLWNYNIGMRTVKTALSVCLCIALYYLLEDSGIMTKPDAFLACTAAVISMQDTIANSLIHGLSRLEGTAIGAVIGMGILYLMDIVNYDIVRVIIIALGIIVLISLCNIFGRNQAIAMGCVVFLAIILQPATYGPLVSSVFRLIDTAIGIVISILINHFIHNPDKAESRDDPGEDWDKE